MENDVCEKDEQLILDSIDQFIERDIRPSAHDMEIADVYPREIAKKMQKLGLFGATIARQYGGLGLSTRVYTKIVERVSACWMSISGIFNSHLIAAAAIERFGTERQKSLWLPKMACGEMRGGIALTEPDCGTDLKAIRTKAVRKNNEFIINGSKMWITNSLKGNFLVVLVVTRPDAMPRHDGLSLILVEKDAGYNTSKLNKLGYNGIDTGAVSFNDVCVPINNLIGQEEGKGLQQILAGLELGRINVAARGVGLALACLQESISYSQSRETFGKPICDHQAIQMKLADMATAVDAARLLVERAAEAYDKGLRCDMEAGMAKLFASETALENSIQAMRIHGAYGYSKEFNIERYYRDAPLLAIGEGTNELQRIIIARQLIERNKIK